MLTIHRLLLTHKQLLLNLTKVNNDLNSNHLKIQFILLNSTVSN